MNRKDHWLEIHLRPVVESSISYSACLLKLGLGLTGGNYQHLKKYIKEYNISTAHFLGQGHLKGKRHSWSPSIPLSECLARDSNYSNSTLKKRLLIEGVLSSTCSICGILPIWNNLPLVFQLDHINGDNRDNRLENLRLLCPNCHAQTITWSKRKNNADMLELVDKTV